MSFIERPVIFECEGERLVGIVSHPEKPAAIGVLVVVGGPQYRIGSHRQFILLARRLAAEGFSVMRFDYRGMGDSTGSTRGFEDIDADIAAGVDAFMAACPEVRKVVLWGLCDGASAALLYWDRRRDSRIGGFCLLNPWVHSEESLAKVHVRHYYGRRLLQRSFWKKFIGGRLDIAASARDLVHSLRLYMRAPRRVGGASFQERMAAAWSEFPGGVLLILSNADHTALEFLECFRADPAWESVRNRIDIVRHDVEGADHTFSSALWRGKVEHAVLRWLFETHSHWHA